MGEYYLSDGEITITINSLGAQLTCLKDIKNGKDYLWDARPEYWARYSPVLFPLVGSLKDKEYTYQGVKYKMTQHGFARDMEFKMTGQTDDTIWFALEDTKETRAIYPFSFTLQIGYQLKNRTVRVMWKVINNGQQDMYFSIGAHPAFVCPIVPDTKREEYFIQFDGADRLRYRLLTENGLVQKNEHLLQTSGGIIPFDKEMFSHDALIFENNQTKSVSLLTPDKVPYITVRFDAPLVGLWTPTRGDAPFLCIEPWYGRCDAEDFNGSLEDREWSSRLGVNETFYREYTIEALVLS